MKNKYKIISILLIVVITSSIVYYQKFRPEPSNITTEKSIVGCYVAHLAKDVFTLGIKSQQNELFEGILNIQNFEKDSSTGTLSGIYKDGILLADYTFLSEGVISVGPVIFKKVDDGFVRGYGPTNEADDSFSDINNIKFDSSVIYSPSVEGCSNSI